MKMNIQPLGILLLGLTLGACEKVKTEEARADLPQTTVEDTLVFSPDSADVDTTGTAYTGDDSTYNTYASEWPEEDMAYIPRAERGEDESNARGTATSGATSAPGTVTETDRKTTTTSATVKTETKTTPSKRTVAAVYRKPSRASLQRSLARDARRSSQMSLEEVRRYWTTRQYYYKRAAKEVKYVAGKVKININQEETKIETPKGKVKMEPGDVKVKPD
ncbi:hypothetical protein GU926_08000 [Nibribacter ruber]|uniref:Lipoprotein n=1 Tax=Nibribacter ruber TaxID=2698458 RepID=A0A6P1NYS9_9BACT|nr:hypothetical protein [Nibribacter ruber]QHL87379.1 hypothetical protein GU926_08000 [Nibribacter ruber]